MTHITYTVIHGDPQVIFFTILYHLRVWRHDISCYSIIYHGISRRFALNSWQSTYDTKTCTYDTLKKLHDPYHLHGYSWRPSSVFCLRDFTFYVFDDMIYHVIPLYTTEYHLGFAFNSWHSTYDTKTCTNDTKTKNSLFPNISRPYQKFSMFHHYPYLVYTQIKNGSSLAASCCQIWKWIW